MIRDHFFFKKKLTDFSPIFGPKTAQFQGIWDFPWPKMRHHGLKTG